MTCTFFGHKDTPLSVEAELMKILTELIEKDGVERFYVGNQGSFDRMAVNCLVKLKKIYQIDFAVVIAYIDEAKNDDLPTVYPEGMEYVPRRFAIDRRNFWMVNASDVVVAYVKRGYGGVKKFRDLAEGKGKRIIDIAGEYGEG